MSDPDALETLPTPPRTELSSDVEETARFMAIARRAAESSAIAWRRFEAWGSEEE